MDTFWQSRTKNERSAKQHLNVIKNISNKLEFDGDYHKFISEFDKVKSLLGENYSPTRQKYSTIIRMFLDYLDLKESTYKEFVEKYNQISRRSQTPAPRPRPNKGPNPVIYNTTQKNEKIQREQVKDENKQVTRLSRRIPT